MVKSDLVAVCVLAIIPEPDQVFVKQIKMEHYPLSMPEPCIKIDAYSWEKSGPANLYKGLKRFCLTKDINSRAFTADCVML